jgi:hypothetical protein
MHGADKPIYQNTRIIDTRVIDYCSKCCMVKQKCKINISGVIFKKVPRLLHKSSTIRSSRSKGRFTIRKSKKGKDLLHRFFRITKVGASELLLRIRTL